MSHQRAKFSGHQTFPLRYGWLEKGYAFVSSERSFNDESAIVALGVGKNMVSSIKYWCEVANIIDNDEATSFGTALLNEEQGWDPYLEDLASWWLLHWQIAANPQFRTSATALFSYLSKPEFSKHDMSEAVLKLAEDGKKAPSDNIIMRDVDCYVRSYCGVKRFEKKPKALDAFACPLQELNLVQPVYEGDMYRLGIGGKASLPAEIIGYTLCEYFHRHNRSVMTIQSLIYQPGSPGRVFALDENAVVEAVQELQEHSKWGGFFSFTEAAGVAQVQCSMPFEEAATLLQYYYYGGGN